MYHTEMCTKLPQMQSIKEMDGLFVHYFFNQGSQFKCPIEVIEVS